MCHRASVESKNKLFLLNLKKLFLLSMKKLFLAYLLFKFSPTFSLPFCPSISKVSRGRRGRGRVSQIRVSFTYATHVLDLGPMLRRRSEENLRFPEQFFVFPNKFFTKIFPSNKIVRFCEDFLRYREVFLRFAILT